MDIMKEFKRKARIDIQTIVLPEGDEPRIYLAAEQIIKEGLADIILLGDKNEILKQANGKIDLKKVEFIDPKNSSLTKEFSEKYFEVRKHKGITKQEALKIMKDPLYFGTMLVHTDRAQGMVAGSINTTGNVLSPAFQIIKTKPDISVVSGAFVMNIPGCKLGHDGILLFSDCAVNPNPDAKQLAEIAIASANTVRSLLDLEPTVSMLSFSTKGSAKHKMVDKIRKATEIAQKKAPNIEIDGELQADAALVPNVAEQKSPTSSVAGKANILIFPDLQSGNIGYKLVQRLANAEAIGPILQGIAKPVNDLSRGCSREDVINVSAITAVQAQQ
jgi:phosphate acetyltransferase